MNHALLYAHRGAAVERPENTLASFERALEHGVDALEMDVHLTSDGAVVVAHDPDGWRRAGVAAQIRHATLAQVKQWDVGGGARIPTLEEVLLAFPGVRLNVDVKQRQPDMIGPVVALLHRMRAAERVLLASFYSATLRRIRALGYGGPTSMGREEVVALLALPEAVLRRNGVRAERAQLPTRLGRVSLMRPWVIAKCHALGLKCDFWTINDPAEARAALALGVDGVMTDDPARIAPVFAERRRSESPSPPGRVR